MDIAKGAQAHGQNPNEVINSNTIKNSGIFNKQPAPPPSKIGGFGGKVIEGTGAASFEDLSKNTGGLHYNPISGNWEHPDNSAVNNAVTQFGVPIGADGNPNFDYANNEIRKQFGLPEMKTENGVRMYKDAKTGIWVSDPNAKPMTVTAPGVQQTPGMERYGTNSLTGTKDNIGLNRTIAGRAFGLNNDTAVPENLASNVNKDVKATTGKGGSVPKINKPGSIQVGGIGVQNTPSQQYDARGNDTVGTIQEALTNSDSKFLQELAKRIHFSAQGKGRGAAYIGGFEDQRSAYTALAELQNNLDPEVLKNLNVTVKQNPANGKFQIQFRGGISPTDITSKNEDEQPGGVADKSIEATTKANDFNQQIRDAIGQMVALAQQQKSGTFGAAQTALGREIPGVGETSPQQEAQVQRQLAAIESQGIGDINRDFNQNARVASADLLNRGFAGSNLASPYFEESAFRPADIAKRDLLKTMIIQENNIRDSIAKRQNSAVETLNKVNEPAFPTNIPGVNQYQPGTFTPKATYQDVLGLADLFMKGIPGLDQQSATELAKSFITANSQIISSPGIGTQLLTATTGVGQAFAGKGTTGTGP